MHPHILLHKASPEDAHDVAKLVGKLLTEMAGIGEDALLGYDFEETLAIRRVFLAQDDYAVFIASDGADHPLGFVSLYQNRQGYASCASGTIAEIYVRPEHRADGVGQLLIDQAKQFARDRQWTQLDVATQPYALHLKNLEFFQQLGFVEAGGRSLRFVLREKSWPLMVANIA